VGVRLRAGHRSVRTSVVGLRNDTELHRVLDNRNQAQVLPVQGLVLSEYLASELRVHPGDMIDVEMLEGRRQERSVEVVAEVREFVGATAYMEITVLNRLMREGVLVNGAFVAAENGEYGGLYAELKSRPRIAGVSLRDAAIDSFN